MCAASGMPSARAGAKYLSRANSTLGSLGERNLSVRNEIFKLCIRLMVHEPLLKDLSLINPCIYLHQHLFRKHVRHMNKSENSKW